MIKKVFASGFSKSQLYTRISVFRALLGTRNIIPCDDAKSAANDASCPVILNCDVDADIAAMEFSMLRGAGAPIFAYSDMPLGKLLLMLLSDYDECSLLVCMTEAEEPGCRERLQSGKRYVSIAAAEALARPDEGTKTVESLTRQQFTALFCMLHGLTVTETAGMLGTSVSSARRSLERARLLFGGGVSFARCFGGITWML